MATQNADGVPVSILPETDHQHLRLLELPPELLALLVSENPPRLELKSKEDLDGTAKDANVVLCTPDTTYNIRQVSTSNSVYIMRPHEVVDDSGGPYRLAVEAVAKCDSTLELIPTLNQSALPFIKAALPVYSSTGNYGTSTTKSKADLFSHIPLNQAECEEAWSELACFESIDPAGCFIPHAKVRAQIWEAALTAAVADGANLKDPYISGDIPVFALDLQEDWSHELLAALFASVSIPTPGGNLAIDEEKCILVVGMNLLEAKSGGGASISRFAFLQAWKDVVPEAWREKCNIALLRGVQDTAGTLTFIDSSSVADTKVETPADAKSTLGAKRKWHEKFRPQKKT